MRARCPQEVVYDAVNEVGVARKLDFCGMLAGVGVRRGEGEKQDGERKGRDAL
jgi:hypothetical protein